MSKLSSHADRHRLVRLAARLCGALAAATLMTGCQSIAVNANNAAQLRLVDASIDAGGLDFYANNNALAYNLGYGSVSSYITATPGTYTITADRAGTRQVLTTGAASLSTGRQYTVLVGNVAANMQQVVLTDQSQAAPAGQIAVRVLDQATRVGAVDVYLVPSTGKLSTTAAFVTNLNFNSNTGYLSVPAGTYAIAVVPTGTVPLDTTTTLLTGAQVGYRGGAVRTIVLLDAQVTTTPGVVAVVASDFDSAS